MRFQACQEICARSYREWRAEEEVHFICCNVATSAAVSRKPAQQLLFVFVLIIFCGRSSTISRRWLCTSPKFDLCLHNAEIASLVCSTRASAISIPNYDLCLENIQVLKDWFFDSPIILGSCRRHAMHHASLAPCFEIYYQLAPSLAPL